MRQISREPDRGFTMMEVLVALGIIAVLMASLSAYFVRTTTASRYQSQLQAATRLAQTGMEAARGYGGPTLLLGRAQCGSCLSVAAYDSSGLMANMVRWDAPVTGVTPTVPVPKATGNETQTVNKVSFARYYFLGKCWQATAGGLCGTNTALPVAMVRLVVAVVWTSDDCRYDLCIRASSALFSANPDDPVFTQ
jgi:prepilin-type N-terminal cleavage/methylation domain-containing protein